MSMYRVNNPGFHVLNKAPGGFLNHSWNAENTGGQAGSARLVLTIVSTGRSFIGPPANVLPGAISNAVLFIDPLADADFVAGNNQMRLEMFASNEQPPVATHIYTVNFTKTPPPPPVGPIIDAVGTPTIT